MDGIIFDIDGTIWDSREPVAKAWNDVLENETDLDMRVNPEILTGLFGKPMTEIRDSLFGDLPEEERGKIAARCYERENEYLYEEPGTVYPGIMEAIKELSARYPLFIASNCQDGYIQVLLKSTGLSDYFKDFICYDDTGLSKGKNIRILMERNGLNEVVYVGDTKGDEEACREAGIPFAYVSYGLGEAKRPDYVIDRAEQLTELW